MTTGQDLVVLLYFLWHVVSARFELPTVISGLVVRTALTSEQLGLPTYHIHML